jgi:hypothetical protein
MGVWQTFVVFLLRFQLQMFASPLERFSDNFFAYIIQHSNLTRLTLRGTGRSVGRFGRSEMIRPSTERTDGLDFTGNSYRLFAAKRLRYTRRVRFGLFSLSDKRTADMLVLCSRHRSNTEGQLEGRTDGRPGVLLVRQSVILSAACTRKVGRLLSERSSS